MIGTSVDLLLPARFRPAHHRLRSGFFTENTARPATGRQMGAGRTLFGLRKNGSEVEVEVRLSPIRTGEGMKVLAAIVDVTDRVRREASTRQSQQLHAIGRVTAGVAHDFNNLLTVLSGSVELLLDAVPDRPEALAWGQSALRAITRGRELTDRLLSFARKQVLNPQPIPITVLFSELQALLGHLFEVNTVARTELVITPGAPGLSVLADHAQLEAALINLAVNARDAMANGGCLRISARQAFADPAVIAAGTYTVISVVDTGKGMDAATLAQACEPFFTTKGTAGTGLGLSMVQGFARQSGGEAIISSVVGQGTTIDLWLPAAGAPSAIEPPRPGAAPAPAAGRILLVDDNADALTVLSAFLRAAGHDVTIRDNAERALADLTAGQRFDAMVTDFAMPGMNGRELLTRARRIDPSMPGLMITGFTDPDILADLKGVVVLRKPFSRVDLTTTVRRIIEAARAAATS
jgi:signal transduction histidine kinase/CheY-like chemotaxis protein